MEKLLKLFNLFPSWISVLPYALGLFALIGLYGYGEHVGYDKAKTKYTAEIKTIQLNDDKLTELAWKAKQNAEDQYKQKANQADANYTSLADKYNANLLRFRYLQTSRISSNPSSSNSSPTSSNRSGGDSVLPTDTLSITYKDAQICLTNTARLQIVRTWALRLQETPRALPKPQINTDTNSTDLTPTNGLP